MRTIDLAVFADLLAGRASTLAARLERARDAVRHAAIEREARGALDPPLVERLDGLGVLGRGDVRALREEIAGLAADLVAVESLQGWVERKLFEAREESEAGDGPPGPRVYRGASATSSPPSSS